MYAYMVDAWLNEQVKIVLRSDTRQVSRPYDFQV